MPAHDHLATMQCNRCTANDALQSHPGSTGVIASACRPRFLTRYKPNLVLPQLLHWQKRREAGQVPASPRLLRLAPAFKQPPPLLVPRQVKDLKPEALDPRGAFLLTTPRHSYIWRVSVCSSNDSVDRSMRIFPTNRN